MTSKITLHTKKEILDQIKEYAKRKNTSITELVNNFFESILEKEKNNSENKISEELFGILKKETDEKEYKKYIEEKYL